MKRDNKLRGKIHTLFVSTQLLESTECPKSYLTGFATRTINSPVNFFIT